MSDQTDLSLIQQQIATGFDAEDFKQTDLGKFLMAKAREDMLTGLEALKNVDPYNTTAIIKLQSIIHTAESFFVWIEEAIQTGRGAMQAFEEITTDPADPT